MRTSILLVCLISLQSCQIGRWFGGDGDDELDEPIEMQPPQDVELEQEPPVPKMEPVRPEPRKYFTVSRQQWKCCIDICRGKPKSVSRKSEGDPWVVCECMEPGRIFKVMKTPNLKGKLDVYRYR